MTEAILLVACALLACAVGALAVRVGRLRSSVAELAARVVASPALVADPGAPSSTSGSASVPSSTNGQYVITRLGSADVDADRVERPDARLFADLMLRESVVKAASFAHGVRRGLAPESRNRIWFEMRREVKRVRKARKAEEREAIREWKARQRASMREDDAA